MSAEIIPIDAARRRLKAKPRRVTLDREASSPFLPISPAAAWVFGFATCAVVASAMMAIIWGYQR